jgi:hypothetical protein
MEQEGRDTEADRFGQQEHEAAGQDMPAADRVAVDERDDRDRQRADLALQVEDEIGAVAAQGAQHLGQRLQMEIQGQMIRI